MGINLVWVCMQHGRYHTSMRGEEGIDFQALVRSRLSEGEGCPSRCFRDGRIRVFRDADFDPDKGGFREWWPVWEDRPAERSKHGHSGETHRSQ